MVTGSTLTKKQTKTFGPKPISGYGAEEIETGYGRFEHSFGCRAKGLQWDDKHSQWAPELSI